jgi:hypothetical protein
MRCLRNYHLRRNHFSAKIGRKVPIVPSCKLARAIDAIFERKRGPVLLSPGVDGQGSARRLFFW